MVSYSKPWFKVIIPLPPIISFYKNISNTNICCNSFLVIGRKPSSCTSPYWANKLFFSNNISSWFKIIVGLIYGSIKSYSKCIKRIYYVLSAIWVLFIFVIAGNDWADIPLIIIAIGFIPPIVVYYVLSFIIEGFKE